MTKSMQKHTVVLVVLVAIVTVANGQFGFGNLPSVPNNPVQTAKDAAGAVGNAATKVTELFTKQFGDFKGKFNKVYANAEEELLRKNIFAENSEKIINLAKDVAFKLTTNEYSDLLHDEFNKAVNGFKSTGKPAEEPITPPEKVGDPAAGNKIPDSVDWRERGGVTPVKSQGTCAGCWAFAAGGALEGHYFRKTGKLVEISPQNLIDCSGPYGNDGCDGGLMIPAFEYVKKNKGVSSNKAYPFEAKNGKCRYDDKSNSDVANAGYKVIPEGNEKVLEAVVATLGPVAVAIDASQPAFQFYGEGIYYDPKCKNKAEDVNHAVVVVGYGAEPDGTKYWLVKNSYGESWGMNGYVKMAKDRGNHCGIATYASFPNL